MADVQRSWFADLGGLKSLNLSGNSLTGVSSDDLSTLHSLQTLDLSGNLLRRLGTDTLDACRSALQSLYLSDNRFTSLDDRVFHSMWSLQVGVSR